MGIRKAAAQAVSAVSTVALQKVFRRPAGNFPGKMALYVDPRIIADMAPKLRRGSICVVGTNGKTTITNMVADCLEAAGHAVVCNRGGANLDSGVATSLLHASSADWGVFECDELWLAKILPGLQSNYVLLLNLFHDQVDRVGEIDRIQESIVAALEASPNTVLVYNADDPHCEAIARLVENDCIPFGVGEALPASLAGSGSPQICQMCDHLLEYAYQSYDQLGAYSCPQCGFARSPLKFSARNVCLDEQGMSFDVVAATDSAAVAGGEVAHLTAAYTGTYMVYNLLAVYIAGHLAGLANDVIQQAIDAFDPQNGRLEYLQVHGHRVLLNLAKNPTGFNQNLRLISQDAGRVAAAFFVNDMEGDGRDVSWIWDIDFESLAGRTDVDVFVGGMRRNDLQVRLKYAGIPAWLVDDAADVMRKVAALPQETAQQQDINVYMIANYTSLPQVRADCVAMANNALAPLPTQADRTLPSPLPSVAWSGNPVHILHLLPDLLNQGGDAGNVAVLAKRCEWRGLPVDVRRVLCGLEPDFGWADIVVLGDGFDREQRLACENLLPYRDAFADYVARGGVVLAIDGGLQVLGSSWFIDDKEYAGLGLVDIRNSRADNRGRIVGDIVVDTALVEEPVVGFENHEGVTTLAEDTPVFGSVLHGVGNNEDDKTEGVHVHNLVGTYVHGPVLAKSPQLADYLITRALEVRDGTPPQLAPLDDTAETAARVFMLERLGIR